MAGQQRVYKARIRSTQSLKKMFRAQELIAASRIGKARDRVSHAGPYARAVTRAASAVQAHGRADHRFLTPRTDTQRVAVLLVASDRGMAGAYSATVIRETERLVAKLRGEGKEVVLYLAGRRAVAYYTFRQRAVERSWTGQSDAPQVGTADEIATALLEAYERPGSEGVGEVHVVYTRFVNMVTQRTTVERMLPIELVEGVEERAQGQALPLYEYEPDPVTVLDALLPRYVRARLYACLLESAASELAARQRAMHTATDNAEDLIRTYTRLANQARQGEITQEISEIVSGADALAS
ncbi:F0F1 ATP synthase subunit gamma [Cellulomonas endophytica]|uniref:F0F1 ATP synthase subunit gamma n=1 Tax=Cellulomonas endophytica TaxID=2494735 RepID=UPI00101135AA|nr:F0F1 ATP synthase subunit gamma [Cellulomonas endophytica]